MIEAQEIRLGNTLLYKNAGRIATVRVTHAHLEALAAGESASFFPVVLKPEALVGAGFIENKDYPLLPSAREFRLVLPVIGKEDNAIMAWLTSAGACFARATVNGLPVSVNVHHLHGLQNLFFALTGTEMPLR
ncbi:MAG: hypothetical protein JWP27_1878 [Flaviaesturariibacter sp.]|nr:hypothetical protein [Flaviaesturariibacter sp.]